MLSNHEIEAMIDALAAIRLAQQVSGEAASGLTDNALSALGTRSPACRAIADVLRGEMARVEQPRGKRPASRRSRHLETGD